MEKETPIKPRVVITKSALDTIIELQDKLSCFIMAFAESAVIEKSNGEEQVTITNFDILDATELLLRNSNWIWVNHKTKLTNSEHEYAKQLEKELQLE